MPVLAHGAASEVDQGGVLADEAVERISPNGGAGRVEAGAVPGPDAREVARDRAVRNAKLGDVKGEDPVGLVSRDLAAAQVEPGEVPRVDPVRAVPDNPTRLEGEKRPILGPDPAPTVLPHRDADEAHRGRALGLNPVPIPAAPALNRQILETNRDPFSANANGSPSRRPLDRRPVSGAAEGEGVVDHEGLAVRPRAKLDDRPRRGDVDRRLDRLAERDKDRGREAEADACRGRERGRHEQEPAEDALRHRHSFALTSTRRC